ncbi:MAG: hypothetical protein A6F71_02680 [Cycloclasticus sp. symbiont of Poecilosclerida sp. M]|nr:MAG: hypothetical protein A6F71_02680 [Cycloclasticus sp. symbiont of Poecilosclerida sp. M]
MRIIDTSSIIFAWDDYPLKQFPPLWDWIAQEIRNNELAISQTAFQEVRKINQECADWLDAEGINKIAVSNAILQEALRMQNLLGIDDDDYHPLGVGENDILIVATAKVENSVLINNEAIQNNLPKNMKKYKIPGLCGLNSVGVSDT